jgi:tetratricopeptide (TPR) repeat protein
MAWAYHVGGQYGEAISAANKVLNQNPRSAYALRFLAASLAKQGRLNEAAEALQGALNIEPQLTLTKLRARLMFIERRFKSEVQQCSIDGMAE